MKSEPLFADRPDGPGLITGPATGTCEELFDLLTQEREGIGQLLAQRGAILLRAFGLRTAEQFARCMAALEWEPFGYIGGDSPRTAVTETVFTSTEHPPTAAISLHHEMSYLPRWPRHLAFFAANAPVVNGQTSLAFTSEVTAAIDPGVSERFAARGLSYRRCFPAGLPFGRSWQETFGTSDRGEVEQIATDQASVARWDPDGSLTFETLRPAFLETGNGPEKIWFNQAEQWHPSALPRPAREALAAALGPDRMPHDCRYADGSPIDELDLVNVRQSIGATKLLFDWHDGDVLLLDNQQLMHGREPFAGQRRILAYLAA